MKLSFSTLSCPEWSWSKVMDEAVKNGYSGIEVRGINGEMYLPEASVFLDENIEVTKAKLMEMGLTITNLGSSVKFHDAITYDQNLDEGKAYIDLAQRLGAAYVRVFGNNLPEEVNHGATIHRVCQGINALCQYGESKGVSCLLETHGDFVDVETLGAVIDGIKYPNFGLIWDVAHTFKLYGEDVTDLLKVIGPFVQHVHLKDLKKTKEDYDLCMLGAGDLPFRRIIEDLAAIGYDGYLSLEWEKKWVPALEAPEVVIPLYARLMGRLLNNDGD